MKYSKYNYQFSLLWCASGQGQRPSRQAIFPEHVFCYYCSFDAGGECEENGPQHDHLHLLRHQRPTVDAFQSSSCFYYPLGMDLLWWCCCLVYTVPLGGRPRMSLVSVLLRMRVSECYYTAFLFASPQFFYPLSCWWANNRHIPRTLMLRPPGRFSLSVDNNGTIWTQFAHYVGER